MEGFFIAGSVALADIDECAEGAKVTLKDLETKEVRETKTDSFGSFDFDGLKPDREYLIDIEYLNYKPKSMKIRLQTDTYLGYIFLERLSSTK